MRPKNTRRDSTKKFSEPTRKPTEEEAHNATLCIYTYDVYLENGSVETVTETSETYEYVAAYFRAAFRDDLIIVKIERITRYEDENKEELSQLFNKLRSNLGREN